MTHNLESGEGLEGGVDFFFFFCPQPHPQAPYPRQPPTFLPALFYHLYVLYVMILLFFVFYIICFCSCHRSYIFYILKKTSYNKNKFSCSNQCNVCPASKNGKDVKHGKIHTHTASYSVFGNYGFQTRPRFSETV